MNPFDCRDNVDDSYKYEFKSVYDLIDILHEFKEIPVAIAGCGYAPLDLISWRGSYNLPAILCKPFKVTSNILLHNLEMGLTHPHAGYKGGEFTFDGNDIPRVVNSESNSGLCSIYDYKVIEDSSGEPTLTFFTYVNNY